MKERGTTKKPLLTKREKEVFELLVQDKTTKEIARQLFISEKTVRNHISNLLHTNCKIEGSAIRALPFVYPASFYVSIVAAWRSARIFFTSPRILTLFGLTVIGG